MRSTTTTKYFAYFRKSSEGEDRQVQSLERQSDEVKRMIEHLGITVVETFQESRSAMIPDNRPEFNKMIKGIRAGKANGIVCWHMNRLARNPLESGIVQQLLEDGKIQSILTKDREYTAADNAIIFSVESSLATQYSKDLGKMTKSGMDKKVSMGVAPIKAPLGYLNTKMAEHGTNYIIKDPERFVLMRKVWELMLTGNYVPLDILKIMKDELGLKPRTIRKGKVREISLSCLYDILNNPFYSGLFKYKGATYKGNHEAMITVEEFETVQMILGRKGQPRKQKHSFLYTGKIKCGSCGCAITATIKTKRIKSTGKFKTFTYYYCTQRKKGITCTTRTILKESELEEKIVEVLENITISDKFFKLASAIITSNTESIKAQAQALCISQQKELQGTEKEIKNLLQLRIGELISDEEYRAEKQSRENKMVVLNQKMKQNENNPYFIFEKIENRFSSLKNLKQRFLQASGEGKKNIFKKIGSNYELIGERLNIIKPLWLEAISNEKKKVEAEISMFELNKYVDLKAFYNQFQDLFPLLCALVKEVGTNFTNEMEQSENTSED